VYPGLDDGTVIKVYPWGNGHGTYKKAKLAAECGIGPKIFSELLPCKVIDNRHELYKVNNEGQVVRVRDAFCYITEKVTPGDRLCCMESYYELRDQAEKIWLKFYGSRSDFRSSNWGITDEGKIVIIDFGLYSGRHD